MAVLLFHAGFSWASGGFSGVDVFFVISGFLITGSVVQAIEQQSFHYWAFLQRRFWRLGPALFVVLLAVALAAPWLGKPVQVLQQAKVLIAVLLLGANLYYWRTADYFADEAALDPLLHTWSLSVEEQFYLLYPLVLLGTAAVVRSQWTWWALLAALCIGSFAAADWAAGTHPTAAFFLLPARAWELGTGGVLALAVRPMQKWRERHHVHAFHLGQLVQWLGVLTIIVASVQFDERTPFPGRWAVVPVGGAALVISGGTLAGAAAPLLEWSWLRWIGRISYSLYLWHQVVFVFARWLQWYPADPVVTVGSVWAALALLAVSLLLGFMSWRHIEEPFRRGPATMTTAQAWWWRLLPAALLLMSTVAVRQEGWREVIVGYRFTPEQRAMYSLVTQARQLPPTYSDGACRFLTESITEAVESRFATCRDRHGPATLIIGDSHARNVFQAVAPIAPSPFVVGVVRTGCRPGNASAGCPTAQLEAFVTRHAADIRHVAFIQSGAYLLTDAVGRVDVNALFRAGVPLRLHLGNVEATLVHLTRLGAHTTVTWLGPWVQPRLPLLLLDNVSELHIAPATVARFVALDSALAARTSSVGTLVRYRSLLHTVGGDPRFLYDGGCLAFRDEDHLSPCGERKVGPALSLLLFDRASLP